MFNCSKWSLNLILNAIEAMSSVEEGARELSISTEQNRDRGILVAVRDSGPGIDPEHLRAGFRALLHDEGQRAWDGIVDLPVHHRRAMGVGCGWELMSLAAPFSVHATRGAA